MQNLPDMQKTTTGFAKIAINKVGMRNVELPISFFHPILQEVITSKGTFSSYCNLVEDVKGVNMSRISRSLIDVLKTMDYSKESNLFKMMEDFSYELKKAHQTDNIYTKLRLDYPVYATTPYTMLDSPEYVQLTLETTLKGDELKNYLSIHRIGMSLCPCSKEMSLLGNNVTQEELELLKNLPATLSSKVLAAGFGAHNQRSHVDLTVEVPTGAVLDIESLIKKIDDSYSCTTKTVLKRPDEKYETEVSYLGGFFAETEFGEFEFTKVEGSGPKFVEDIARDVATKLNSLLDKDILDYVVVVNNDESIHSGDIEATAILSAGRNLQ